MKMGFFFTYLILSKWFSKYVELHDDFELESEYISFDYEKYIMKKFNGFKHHIAGSVETKY